MEIREATPDDVGAIVEIGQETWPVTYAFAGADYIAHGLATWWSPEAIVRSLETTVLLVAAEGDELVGVGNIDLRGQVPIVWKLYVRPAAQGTGAGSALLSRLVERAGGRPVRLSYLAGNDRAAGFYARHGFAPHHYREPDQPGWPAEEWLERPGSGLLLAAVVEFAVGHAETGQRYEDAVLGLLDRHGGTLERRTRGTDGTTEVHLIRFAARAGYESFMVDPERLAHREAIGDAAPTTRVIEVGEV